MYNSYTEMSTLGDGETVKLILEATSADERPIPRWNTEQIEVHIVREKSGKMVILDAKVLPVDEEKLVFAGISGEEEKENCGFLCEILGSVTKWGKETEKKVSKWGKETEEKLSKWGKKVGAKIRPCGKNTHGKVKAGDVKEHEGKKEKGKGDDEDIFTIMPIPIPDRVPSNPGTWRRPPYSRPHHRPHTDEKESHRHARPWSHHHHHNHRPHHMTHTHSTASAAYKVFTQVLIPIAIGVVAGMLVSLMGMVVGHFAVLAYQKAMGVVRTKRCAPVVEVGDEEVAKGLLSQSEGEYRDEEEEEAPPMYDAQTAQEVSDEKQ